MRGAVPGVWLRRRAVGFLVAGSLSMTIAILVSGVSASRPGEQGLPRLWGELGGVAGTALGWWQPASRLTALLLGLWGLGVPTIRWFGVHVRFIPPSASTAIGLGVFALGAGATGVLGLLHSTIGGSALGILFIAAMAAAHRQYDLLLARGTLCLSGAVRLIRSWWSIPAVILVAGWFVSVNAGLSVPEGFWDALVYHLAVPQRQLAETKITDMTPLFSNFPFLVQNTRLFALSWGGEMVPRLGELVASLGCAVVLWDIGRTLGDARAGALAGTAFLTTPLVGLLSGHAGVDLACTWLALASLSALTRLATVPISGRTAGGPALLCGVLAGLTTATKYQGAATFGLVSLLLASGAGWSVPRRPSPALRVKMVAWCAAGWLAACGFYAAKSALLTGDPLAPFGRMLLSTAVADHTYPGAYADDLAGLRSIELSGSGPLRGYTLHFAAGLLGPLLGACLLLFLRPGSRRGLLLLAYAGGFLSLWMLSVPARRFILPAWGAYLVALFSAARGQGRSGVRMQVGFFAVHAASSLIWMPRAIQEVARPIPAESGPRAREAHYARTQLNSPVGARAFLDEMGGLAPGRRVLCLGEPRGYLCGPWAVAPSTLERHPLAEDAVASRSANELVKRLRQRGIAYLLLNEGELMRTRAWSGGMGERFDLPAVRGLFRNHMRLVYARSWVSVYEIRASARPGELLPEALRIVPGSRSALLARLGEAIQARVRSGDHDGATRVGWLLVASHPASGVAWNLLADALMASERRREALGAYENAVEHGARNASVYLNLGSLLAEEGRLVPAEASLRRAASMDPLSPEIRRRLYALYATAHRAGRGRSP